MLEFRLVSDLAKVDSALSQAKLSKLKSIPLSLSLSGTIVSPLMAQQKTFVQ
jgi:hypothetical protein